MIITDKNKINDLLTRGVDKIIVESELKEKLLSGRKLRIKFGIDPTGTQLHLGHTIPLRKLRIFQELGHQIVLVIGSFTGQIGDPTDKMVARPALGKEQVAENMKTYSRQLNKILDLSQTEIRFNNDWFATMKLDQFFEILQKLSLNKVLERKDFQQRLARGQSIHLQEALYPVLQAYDTLILRADVEVGGHDQLLNMLMGRELQVKMDQVPQNIMALALLTGNDQEKKMSKSIGNVVNIEDVPEEIYGKIMSIPDEMIIKYFTLCTDLSLIEIKQLSQLMDKQETNPRDLKMRLAREIVTLYYDINKAKQAEEKFKNIFQKKQIPTEMNAFNLLAQEYSAIDVLVMTKLTLSKAEARRLIEQGGVKINQTVIKDWRQKIMPENDMVIQAGKRKFIKIRLTKN
ncbi:MAG: tyrosine--tRNA ligase [Candidatus Aenigmarchaeota archaeon]|nr:tyrosine--tRNA ligase [Candidatus Aenigmarchaeota archaeon]